MWTSSRGCRRRSRSIRRARAVTRARPWARSPRSTTTCVCCLPASVWRTIRRRGSGWNARLRSRSWIGCSSWRREPGSRCWHRLSEAARARTTRCWRTWLGRGSPGRSSTISWSSWVSWKILTWTLAATRCTRSRSWWTVSCFGTASSVGSRNRWRRRWAWPKASPRSRSCRARTTPMPNRRRWSSPSICPARRTASRSKSSRPGTSRSIPRMAPVRIAMAWAPCSRWIRSW